MEGCDDANDIDDDACSNTCVMASCGDSTIQQGEQCDDGNDDDTDDCTSLCQTAICGDGFQKVDEECDDGNTDDTDMCVAGCLIAACGDGFVLAGTEGCDDANADETDACTSLCQPPPATTCCSAAARATSTAAAAPAPSAPTAWCATSPTDCMSGACLMNACAPPQTCKDLLAGDPALPSGKYMLDLDGPGPIVAQDVYCDMTTNGGGWTSSTPAPASTTSSPSSATWRPTSATP
jgi:cysteine-rich repeat protein